MQLGTAPVLLLDDVFSELDPVRSRALPGGAPPGSDAAHHGPAGPARGRRRKGLRDGGRRATSRRRGKRRMSPEPFHRRDSEPPAARRVPRGAVAAARTGGRRRGRYASSPGGPRSWGRRWPSTSGPSGSTHSALVVTVDHPAWATQVRRLGDTVLDQDGGVRRCRSAGGAAWRSISGGRADGGRAGTIVPGRPSRRQRWVIGIGGRSEGPAAHCARSASRWNPGSHLLGHCERARLWR